jgi:hypothetical protein
MTLDFSHPTLLATPRLNVSPLTRLPGEVRGQLRGSWGQGRTPKGASAAVGRKLLGGPGMPLLPVNDAHTGSVERLRETGSDV